MLKLFFIKQKNCVYLSFLLTKTEQLKELVLSIIFDTRQHCEFLKYIRYSVKKFKIRSTKIEKKKQSLPKTILYRKFNEDRGKLYCKNIVSLLN